MLKNCKKKFQNVRIYLKKKDRCYPCLILKRRNQKLITEAKKNLILNIKITL